MRLERLEHPGVNEKKYLYFSKRSKLSKHGGAPNRINQTLLLGLLTP